MPPKIHQKDILKKTAEAIRSYPDGELLSSILNMLFSGTKMTELKIIPRTSPIDGAPMLGKRGDVKTSVRIEDVDAVHHFMTVVMGIASGPINGTIGLGNTMDASPSVKLVEPKQITAKMYFKNPVGFESQIKDVVKRLGLNAEQRKKVHAALLPTILLSTGIRICLDQFGEVIGIIGISRDGVYGSNEKITMNAKTEEDF